ncbi:alpha/beta fold hydrolase [Microbispora bryophytorum]|uniref:Alpha/beta hydrolase n=1 Tax=Microbispora bryophytorum TaxID=1460882 RepID=A0A8H9LBB9_9ACTN|nr:alpha/beta hydrolase [Microbispora bryophytorum]MBD3138779.1 alpha/beta hydrolase [Microbispora bryophytorum]TQS10052.1 alpha/beta hydrolase [Microbispora bryophytorum]GGO00175.1 alpha/beta hydrolase [Microbispora bryophytorum]
MTIQERPQAAELATSFVTSDDGTRIAFHTIGRGPGVVLLHGSMETARNHVTMAEELADAFTVHLPDRRGRGQSGPYGDDYSVRKEVEDLDAVLKETGAHYVFGVSASGVAVLQAARTLPAIHKVAVYEPALLLEDIPQLTGWIDRFDREMAEGKVAAALVTSMLGLRLGPPIMNVMPRGLLTWLTGLLTKSEDKNAKPGDATMRMLAPTLHYEGMLMAELADTLDRFADIQAEVLLLGGSKGLPFLKPALSGLEKTIPHVERIEFPGLDHDASGDVSKRNPAGRPEIVAAELRRFFTSAA